MKKLFVSDILNIPTRAHAAVDFVNVDIFTDQQLYIDPCLIEVGTSAFCRAANRTINDFFDCFYDAYRRGDLHAKHYLLSHAGEINHTRLGYGNGRNGHGNTAAGLLRKFQCLDYLANQLNGMHKAIDLTVFITYFNQDGLSDMLTNIIHKELNDFTLEQLAKWGTRPNGVHEFWTWDVESSSWQLIESPCLITETGIILLVPKDIVRFRYLFSVDHFFSRVVLERMQRENTYRDRDGKVCQPTKDELKAHILKPNEHWRYEYSLEYAERYPEALPEYHQRVPEFYYGKQMSDEHLDNVVFNP